MLLTVIGGVLYKNCFYKFYNIYKKTFVLEYLINKVFLLIRDSNTGVFLWILCCKIFYEYLYWRASADGCFWGLLKCVYPSDHSFFYSEIRNFTVVPKWAFVFLQRNTKFHSCTQTAIRFSQRKRKFRILPKGPFVLWMRVQNF